MTPRTSPNIAGPSLAGVRAILPIESNGSKRAKAVDNAEGGKLDTIPPSTDFPAACIRQERGSKRHLRSQRPRGDCPSPNPCTGCCVPSVPRGEDAKSPIGTANVAGYARRGAERPAVILPTPQCSTGTTQSRPYPTRAGKVMESAGHLSKQPVARHHEAKNGSSPGPSGHAAAIFPSGYACEDQRTKAAGHRRVRSMTDELVIGQPVPYSYGKVRTWAAWELLSRVAGWWRGAGCAGPKPQ